MDSYKNGYAFQICTAQCGCARSYFSDPPIHVQQEVKPAHGDAKNSLTLWGDAPRWEYSTAPLMDSDGSPVKKPSAGTGGQAMHFNDMQVHVCLNNSFSKAVRQSHMSRDDF